MQPQPANYVALCVDLDGTLIRTDLLWESLVLLVKQQPWTVFLILPWLLRGRAHLKRELASRVSINPASLPYDREVLEWLRSERDAGRRLILATAADELPARAIADYLGLFQEVVASDGRLNLKGSSKLTSLQKHCGGAFDYAGNSRADIPIWAGARSAIAVNAPGRVVKDLSKAGKLSRCFGRRTKWWSAWQRALRVHQWSKNLLIFIPVLTSHRLFEPNVVERSGLMFLAMCGCASALYIINDLFDLTADRQHPQKCRRPFASGDLPIAAGLAAVPLLLAAAFVTALPLGRMAMGILLCYAVVSLSYSLRLKSRAPLDVFLLSGLYTTRILAGGIATHISLTGWLLSFSLFLFMSLAFTKRVSELRLLRRINVERSEGRGYFTADLEQVNAFAVTSGYISSLVLAFYVNSDQVRVLYRQPLYLWLLFPVLLYWLTRLWMLAWRGEMNEDPVLFAIKWPSTYWAACFSFLLLIIAKFDLPAMLLR